MPCSFVLTWASATKAGAAGARKFYHDDPLERTPTPRDAGNIKSRKLSDYYDFFQNMFFKPGERGARTSQIPAQAVNTLGEAMDSAWYTKRHYWNPMSIEEIVAGPGNRKPPSPQPLPVLTTDWS